MTEPTSRPEPGRTSGDRETPDVVIGNHENKYGGSNPLIRWLTQRFLGDLDELLDALQAERSDARVLEIGCGEGEIAQRLDKRYTSVVGLDLPDAELRGEWQPREGPTFLHGDAHQLPFADDTFDHAVAVEVFEHLTDPDRGLAELARVTSGHLIASVPREPIFRAGNFATGRHVRALGNTPGHLNHWSTRAFLRFVSQVGEVVSVRTPLPWTMVHVRLRPRPTH